MDRSSCAVICWARGFACTIRRDPALTTTTATGMWPSTSSTPMPRNSCGRDELTSPNHVRRSARAPGDHGLVNSVGALLQPRPRDVESPGAYDSAQRYRPRLPARAREMTARGATRPLRIVFDAGMPAARWGPLFHVFRLEHPDLRLEWQPTGFPIRGRSLLDGGDAGLFVEPPPEAGRSALTLDVSPMAVIVAAGDRLAHNTQFRVADILDRPFPRGPNLNPQWASFLTLDEQRG